MYCNSCSFRINKYILQLICVREVCHWVLAQPLQRSCNTALRPGLCLCGQFGNVAVLSLNSGQLSLEGGWEGGRNRNLTEVGEYNNVYVPNNALSFKIGKFKTCSPVDYYFFFTWTTIRQLMKHTPADFSEESEANLNNTGFCCWQTKQVCHINQLTNKLIFFSFGFTNLQGEQIHCEFNIEFEKKLEGKIWCRTSFLIESTFGGTYAFLNM